MDYFLMITSFVGIVLILGIAYYATRLLATFKTGLLEKGWRFIATAGLFLTGAQIAYLFEGLSVQAGILALYVGIILDILGSFFLLVGLRSHFKSWFVGHNEPNIAATIPEDSMVRSESIS